MNHWILVFEFINLEKIYTMKYLFVFLLSGLTFNSFGQNIYNVHDTYYEYKEPSEGITLYYFKKDSSLFTGVIFNCRKNGLLSLTGQVIDGRAEGVHRSWFKNGQISMETNYKEGKENGLNRVWYENGQLEYEGNYKDDRLISEQCWDEDGKEIECY